MVIEEWRKNLTLTKREKFLLAGELKTLDKQILRLSQKHLRVAAFGKVGVGKSSLLNALLGEEFFATDVANGCTRHTQTKEWGITIKELRSVELVDTPGIDEIASKARARLASRIALEVDLIILVIDSDITTIEMEALEILLKSGKPVLLALNRCDQWGSEELKSLVKCIENRLRTYSLNVPIQTISASPRIAQLQTNGKVRSKKGPPRVDQLVKYLTNLLSHQGELLLALNTLRVADKFFDTLKLGRLERSKKSAQGLIGKFATFKACGVAANPLLMLDLATGLAFDTALVIQLSKLYGLQIRGYKAREIAKRLSIYNAFLGGAQIGIQFALGALRQILIIATPISGGLTLASAAPVAVAQAALAVHTTKVTGRLAAEVLAHDSQQKVVPPRAMLERLATSDPEINLWLNEWKYSSEKNTQQLKLLLP